MSTTIISDSGEELVVRSNDGTVVKLIMEDDLRVTAWTMDDPPQRLGELVFDEIENDNPQFTQYHLKRAYFDEQGLSYTSKGFGTAAVRLFKDAYRADILVHRDDGSTRDDGSHPTAMGTAFVARLVDVGLARYWGCDRRDEFAE